MEQEKNYVEKTIKILKNGRDRDVLTREIPVIYKGKDEIVVIKKLSFGEMNKIEDALIKVKVLPNKQTQTDVQSAKVDIMMLVQSVHEAPFNNSPDFYENECPYELGKKLLNECKAFNKMSEEKKDASDGDTPTTPQTQSSIDI